ncbi:MAG: 5-methylcytosine-specific restriction endonuclease McrA [Planctomycetota bacterium]|jgi:5-methylcytosine-specific restriction endonuclease McrA
MQSLLWLRRRQLFPTNSAEIDHAIPKSKGGNNSIDNAQNTCRTCNRSKGSKTTEEFKKSRSEKSKRN